MQYTVIMIFINGYVIIIACIQCYDVLADEITRLGSKIALNFFLRFTSKHHLVGCSEGKLDGSIEHVSELTELEIMVNPRICYGP